jgi:hypothetical protein
LGCLLAHLSLLGLTESLSSLISVHLLAVARTDSLLGKLSPLDTALQTLLTERLSLLGGLAELLGWLAELLSGPLELFDALALLPASPHLFPLTCLCLLSGLGLEILLHSSSLPTVRRDLLARQLAGLSLLEAPRLLGLTDQRLLGGLDLPGLTGQCLLGGLGLPGLSSSDGLLGGLGLLWLSSSDGLLGGLGLLWLSSSDGLLGGLGLLWSSDTQCLLARLSYFAALLTQLARLRVTLGYPASLLVLWNLLASESLSLGLLPDRELLAVLSVRRLLLCILLLCFDRGLSDWLLSALLVSLSWGLLTCSTALFEPFGNAFSVHK